MAGGGPSTTSDNGTSNSPPATSCQPVVASTETGGVHRLLSTTPVAITIAPPTAAATPTPSNRAVDRSTSRLTPATPAAPVAIVRTVNRSPSRPAARPAAISGCSAPRVAATPPGSR